MCIRDRFYRLLLSKETFHRFNRIALLTLLLLSLLLPLVQLTTIEQTEVHQTMLTIEQLLMMADMPVSEVTPAEAVTLSGIQILLMVYLSGVLFFACRHIYSLGRLLMLCLLYTSPSSIAALPGRAAFVLYCFLWALLCCGWRISLLSPISSH